MKKIAVAITIFFLVLLISGVVVHFNFFQQYIAKLLVNKIEKKYNLKIDYESISFNLLTLNISINNLRILDAAQELLSLEKGEIQPHYAILWGNYYSYKKIYLKGVNLNLIQNKAKRDLFIKKDSVNLLNQKNRSVKLIIDKLNISETNIIFQSKVIPVAIQSNDINIQIKRAFNNAHKGSLIAKNLKLNYLNKDYFVFNVNSDFELIDSDINIIKLELTGNEMQLIAKGKVKIFPEISLNLAEQSVSNLSLLSKTFLNQNIEGELSSKSIINYEDEILNIKSEFEIKNFKYNKVSYSSIKGKIFLKYPEINMYDTEVAEGSERLFIKGRYNLSNNVMNMECKWQSIKLNNILESFVTKVKDELLTDGYLSYEGNLESLLDGSSYLQANIYSPNDINVSSSIYANLSNQWLKVVNSKISCPGAYAKFDRININFFKQALKNSEFDTKLSLIVQDFAMLKGFIERNFNVKKYPSVASLLSNIRNFKGKNELIYIGTLESIKEAKLETDLILSSDNLDEVKITGIATAKNNNLEIKSISAIMKDKGKIDASGLMILDKPFYKVPINYNIDGEIRDFNIGSLAFLSDTINKMRGKLNANLNIKGKYSHYLIKMDFGINDPFIISDAFNELKGVVSLDRHGIVLNDVNLKKEGVDAYLYGEYSFKGKRFKLMANALADIAKIDSLKSYVNLLGLAGQGRTADVENNKKDDQIVEGIVTLDASLDGTINDFNGKIDCNGNGIKLASAAIGDFALYSIIENSVARFDITAEKIKASGIIDIFKPFKTEASIEFDNSDLFNLFENLRADFHPHILIGASAKFKGSLIDPDSFEVVSNIEGLEIKIKESIIKTKHSFSLQYSKGSIFIDNAEFMSSKSFLKLDGIISLADAKKTNIEILGGIEEDLMNMLRSDIEIDGDAKVDLKLLGDNQGLYLEGSIDGIIKSIILQSNGGRKMEDLNISIAFAERQVKIAAGNKIDNSELNIKGEIRQFDLIKMLRGEIKQLSSDIIISWREYPFSKLLNLADIKVASSGEMKVEQIGLSVDKFLVSIRINELNISNDKYSLANEGLIEIDLSNGEVEVRRCKFIGLDSNFYLYGKINLSEKAIKNFSIKGLMSLSGVNALIKNVNFDGESEVDLIANGDILSPDIEGEIKLILDYLEWKDYSVFISNSVIKSSIKDRVLNIEECRGEINGGEYNCGGYVGLQEINKPSLEVDVKSNSFSILYPEGLKAIADATVKVKGVYPAFKISGTVNVIEAVFRKDIYPESEALSQYFRKEIFAEPGSSLLYETKLDLNCTLPDYMHFSNNIAKVDATGSMRIIGTLAEPLLAGNLRIYPGGTISYAQKEFTINRGEINYAGSYYWNPQLDISLVREEEIISHNWSEKYKIFFEVKGEVDSLDVKLYSQPSLQEKELVKLLAGKTPNEMAANLFVVFTGKYAGEIAGTIQRAFHLEKFKIEPLLVSNEANPAARFTFGKGLTNNLFLTYSLSLSNSSNQTWIADYSLFRNLSIRALRRDDGSYNTSLRQSWQFGLKLPKEERTKTDSKPTAKVYINNIDFINSIYSKELLSKIIKLEKGSLYNFVAINKSIEELRKFYQQNGYLMVRIIPQKEYVQPDRINLLYSIRPGKKIDLKISNKVPEKKLFNELLELFSRPYNLNYALEEAGRAILYFYKKKGYYKATGKWQIEADDKLKLNYELDKGIKFKKVEPIFEGNKALSSAGLKDIVGYSGSKLIGELYLNLSKIKDKIKLAYAKIGYYFVEINDPIYLYDENKKKLVVKFYLDEKSVSLIKEVMLIGVNKLDRQKIEDEVAMRKGEIFIVEDLYNTVNAIAEIYHNNGYPDALVKFEYKFDNDLNAYVRINVEEGSEAIIDDIEIKGNRLTSTGLIKKQLIFKKGERIDLKKFSTSEDNLYELGVFRKVKIFNQGIEGNSGKQRVYVDVEEIEPFRITYGLRYDSEKKMEYEVELVEQNLFKNAHYTSQRYLKNDTQNDIRFTYGIPSFIRRSWRYDMFVFWQKEEFPSFYTEQWGIALQHQLPINNNVIFQYNYNYKKVHTWEKVTVGPFPFDIEIKVARLISSLIADYRDNKFNPHKGFFYSLEAEFSPRALGSELNFIKIFGQYFNYFQIVQGAVWASSVRVGLANAFDNVLIPSERFFTGGGNSVRGYELNSLGPISPYTGLPMGGEALFVVNQELRFSIYKMISGVLFWDCGNIYKKVKDFNPFDVRQSIGFGLRLDTPLGLIRADIGYKLNKKLQEKPYEVFISLGHMF